MFLRTLLDVRITVSSSKTTCQNNRIEARHGKARQDKITSKKVYSDVILMSVDMALPTPLYRKI